MINLGDFAVGQTVTRRFTTSDLTGLLVTLAGSPAARVRKGGGSGTVITAGVTLTVDVVTGQHDVDVDTTASASYTAGAEYSIELSAGTVNGVSIAGTVVAQFSIVDRLDRVGAAGASLTALGDARIANLDATVSSRTKPSDTQARVTLTDTATALGAAYDAAKTASQAGDAMALTSGERTTLTAVIWAALLTGLTTVGSIGKKLADWVIGTTQTADVATVIAALPPNFSTLAIDANGRVKSLVAMTRNVAAPNFIFAMTDSTTHAPKTGLVNADFTKQESLDGATLASLSGTISEIGEGYYKIDLSAAELNAKFIGLRFAAGGADDLLVGIVTSA